MCHIIISASITKSILLIGRETLTHLLNYRNNDMHVYYHPLPIHLVSSSHVRPLATILVALLHLPRSLASHLMLLMGGPFMLSSHLVLGLPSLLFPLISPSITSFSTPRSSPTTCPKYLKAAYATLDSSVHSGLMFSPIHSFLSLSTTLSSLTTNTTSQMHQFSSSLLLPIALTRTCLTKSEACITTLTQQTTGELNVLLTKVMHCCMANCC